MYKWTSLSYYCLLELHVVITNWDCCIICERSNRAETSFFISLIKPDSRKNSYRSNTLCCYSDIPIFVSRGVRRGKCSNCKGMPRKFNFVHQTPRRVGSGLRPSWMCSIWNIFMTAAVEGSQIGSWFVSFCSVYRIASYPGSSAKSLPIFRWRSLHGYEATKGH